MVPLFGAAYAAPNKGTIIFIDLGLQKTVLIPLANGKIQGLFKAFECFSITFQGNIYFQGLQDSPVYSSTFQACANHAKALAITAHMCSLARAFHALNTKKGCR